MEPTTYDKLATVSVKESKKNAYFLRQFALADGVGARTTAPTEVEFRKYVSNSAICHCVLALAGIIVQSVLGITISGAILTALECFNGLFSIGLYIWLNKRLTAYLQSQNLLFSHLYEESIRPAVQLCLILLGCAIVLCIATIIHGAVILNEGLTGTQMYFYMGVVTFLYVGQGAGNMVLGVFGIALLAYFVKKTIDFYRSVPNFSEETQSQNPVTTTVVRESAGSVEQLAVMDLTDHAHIYQNLPSPPSYKSNSRSVSQSSEQMFFDEPRIYTSDRIKPEPVYAARTRTLSSVETDI